MPSHTGQALRRERDPRRKDAGWELANCGVNRVIGPWVKSGAYWAVRLDLTENLERALDEQGIDIPCAQMGVHLEKTAKPGGKGAGRPGARYRPVEPGPRDAPRTDVQPRRTTPRVAGGADTG